MLLNPKLTPLLAACAVAAAIAVPLRAASAGLTAYAVDTAFPNTQGVSTPGQYDFATLTIFVDPAHTNWIAWNGFATVNLFGAPHFANCSVGEPYAGRCLQGALDDSLDITVTRLSGNVSSTVEYDRNDGNNGPIGQQNVIYGQADLAPDAIRNNFNAVFSYLDEAGAQNAVFTTAGNYRFDFSFQNDFCCGVGHPAIWLLVDTRDPAAVPEPATGAILASAAAFAAVVRRRARAVPPAAAFG